jgi:hypothetical protein
MPEEATLVGGPQDGARIRCVGGVLPARVHVGPKWLGDGYAAWSREPDGRFPAYYLYDGRSAYLFQGYRTEPFPEQAPEEPCRG